MLESRELDTLLGRTLAGCRPLRVVARGRTGVVIEALRLEDERRVDLKVLHPYLVEVSGFEQRFVAEARAAVGRRQPNLQRVYARGSVDQVRFLLLEHLDGRSLDAWLTDDRPRGVAARGAELAGLVASIGAALAALHGWGVSHGDVKPSNVLLTGDGRVVVLDAGLGRILYADDVPILIGAPTYMAPEQAGTEAPGDQLADQYALAIIAYELLVGRAPFIGATPGATLRLHRDQPPPPPSSLMSEASPAVDAVLLRALAKTPTERFASVDAFVGALLTALVPPAATAVVRDWRDGEAPPRPVQTPNQAPLAPAPPVAPASPVTDALPLAPAQPALLPDVALAAPPVPAQPPVSPGTGTAAPAVSPAVSAPPPPSVTAAPPEAPSVSPVVPSVPLVVPTVPPVAPSGPPVVTVPPVMSPPSVPAGGQSPSMASATPPAAAPPSVTPPAAHTAPPLTEIAPVVAAAEPAGQPAGGSRTARAKPARRGSVMGKVLATIATIIVILATVALIYFILGIGRGGAPGTATPAGQVATTGGTPTTAPTVLVPTVPAAPTSAGAKAPAGSTAIAAPTAPPPVAPTPSPASLRPTEAASGAATPTPAAAPVAKPPVPSPPVKPPAGQPAPLVGQFGGEWFHNFGTLQLRQTGAQINGAYQHALTGGTGTITGAAIGNSFTGTWSIGARSGTITWTLASNGATFDGFFVDGVVRRWCGARPDQPFPEGCSYQGEWINKVVDRDDCPMQLTRINLSVQGVYCRGTLQGTIRFRTEGQQTLLSGAWNVAGVAPGEFTLAMSGFDALQFQGNWRGDTANEWCGWRAGADPPSPCLLP